MGGGKHLLLLPVFVLLGRCQDIPNVYVVPSLKQIFTGDLLHFICNTNSNEETVKWFWNDTLLPTWKNKSEKIAAAAPDNSGSYYCENNGKKSEKANITVHEYLPAASLIIETGQPVEQHGGSVILTIENEDGLKGWNCWVLREKTLKRIVLKLQGNEVSFSFQPNRLLIPETIFWCTDKTQIKRSNQVTVRTSDNSGALEMYPLPAMTGQDLTLKCLVWGTNKVSSAVFYKDNTLLAKVPESQYTINNVRPSMAGNYRCEVNYRYHEQTTETPHRLISDAQELPLQVSPVQAVLSKDMECSCPSCASVWKPSYCEVQGKSCIAIGPIPPKRHGVYQCRAMLGNMRTLLSKPVLYELNPPLTWIWITLVIVALVTLALAFYLHKRASNTGQIYEDVALRQQRDDKYDTLQPHGREAEYDTLSPGTSAGQEKGGEYEALNKKEMKEGVYDTLEATGAEGGDGGYEALKKDKMEGAEYETLGTTKSALKKNEAAGGEYETLNKSTLIEGKDEGEYQTLQEAAGTPEEDK